MRGAHFRKDISSLLAAHQPVTEQLFDIKPHLVRLLFLLLVSPRPPMERSTNTEEHLYWLPRIQRCPARRPRLRCEMVHQLDPCGGNNLSEVCFSGCLDTMQKGEITFICGTSTGKMISFHVSSSSSNSTCRSTSSYYQPQ